MVDIFYKNNKLRSISGTKEAAKLVASIEGINNLYALEMTIINSILCGNEINDYKFKLRGDYHDAG